MTVAKCCNVAIVRSFILGFYTLWAHQQAVCLGINSNHGQ